MEEITLELPEELMKILEEVAAIEKINLPQWIQTRLIGQIARDAAFIEVYGTAPPFLEMDFARDSNGELLEGGDLLAVLYSAYKKFYKAEQKKRGNPPTWH